MQDGYRLKIWSRQEISNEEAVATNEQVIAERTGATASEDEFFAEEEVQQDETAALQAEASEAKTE